MIAHIQSKCSQKALDNQQSLKKLRQKMRKLAKKSNKSYKFKYAIERNQKKICLKTRTVKQEVKTRFTATHTMFRSILNDPNETKEADPDMKQMIENAFAINESLVEANVKKKEKLKIKVEDVNKMNTTCKLLMFWKKELHY